MVGEPTRRLRGPRSRLSLEVLAGKKSPTLRTLGKIAGALEVPVSRWGEVLRAVYAQQGDVRGYVALCEQTELSAQDCLVVAGMVKGRCKPDEALAWGDRGLVLGKKQPHGSSKYDLAKMRRELLVKLGRGSDALDDAWSEFREQPEQVQLRGADALRAEGRARGVARKGDVCRGARRSRIAHRVMAGEEGDRASRRARKASDGDLEALSHYATQPAARRLAMSHPDVAARAYRAMGMRILNAKKSKYYDAALSNFENAKRCYERSGLGREWDAVVAAVRQAHHRKVGFMGDFERLVTGYGASQEPSFLDRARSRWSSGGQP